MRGLQSDALQVVEPQVLSAVVKEAYRADSVPLGELRKVEEFDQYGQVRQVHQIRFVGQESFIKTWDALADASRAF
jgi:hypothetical protein